MSGSFPCRVRPTVAITAFIASLLAYTLQGCVYAKRPLNYLSPVVRQGERVTYPPTDNRGYGFSAFESYCPGFFMPAAAAPTRLAVSFKTHDILLCFRSPYVASSPNGKRPKLCSATSLQPSVNKGELVFTVLILGRDVDLSGARGVLEVSGRTTTATGAESAIAPIGASVHDPDADLGTPEPRGVWVSLAIKELTFRFDQPCDPFERYVFVVSGLKQKGSALEVPPVTFEPYKEWRPIPFD